MELEIERKQKLEGKYSQADFYVDKALLNRWKAKVREEGGGNYSKVFEALMRWYLGEKLHNK